uniref:Uncharacterized protein n=1 Tax=Strongyloides stercoralis TaxID=6248 RepID=A0A0K0DSS3_STRER
MSNDTLSTEVPPIQPIVKIESIHLLLDPKTWEKKIIHLNIIILLGLFSYIFCIAYVIIVKKSNSHFYGFKPELVYEIRTESTDEETYNSIFSPEERLAYYKEAFTNLKSVTKNDCKKNINKNQDFFFKPIEISDEEE